MNVKNYEKSIIVVVVLALACLVSVPSLGRAGGYVVLIDPAHGGEDTGVKLSKKVYEKDVTLAVAQYVRGDLNGTKGISVYLTRKTDTMLSVAERIKAAGDVNADLFISLSVNAGFGEASSGYEVYFPGFKAKPLPKSGTKEIVDDMIRNKYLNEGVRFAQIVMKKIETVFPRKGRGLRDTRVPVLENLTIPAVVVEMGFATNSSDRKKLLRANVQKSLARAVGESIKQYFSLSGARK